MRAELEFAVEAARLAGEATLKWFASDELVVESKANESPVTQADREAERLLRERIGEAYPADGIVGEEYGTAEGTSGRTWILDPIDGTKSFLRGVPLYGTLVALVDDGRAVLGISGFPALGEMVFAARGEGAWWLRNMGTTSEEKRPARVSDVERLDRACFSYTSRGGFERAGPADLFARLRAACGLDRGWGDCYGHMLVATGRAELMVDPRLAVWDSAALQPIVEEAGGAFFTLEGEARHDGGSGVSVNAALADEVRRLVSA